jgi:hypothetical protein
MGEPRRSNPNEWGGDVCAAFRSFFFAAARGSGAEGVGDEDADLTGGVALGLVNSFHDLVVLEAGYEIVRAYEVS